MSSPVGLHLNIVEEMEESSESNSDEMPNTDIEVFEVEVVNAETKKSFKKHIASDGRTYIEVEPDAQYFIELKVVSTKKVVAHVVVDGVSTGYLNLLSNLEAYFGQFQDKDGELTTTAFKFKKIIGSVSAVTPFIGKIEVVFHSAKILEERVPPERLSGNSQLKDPELTEDVMEKSVYTTKGDVLVNRVQEPNYLTRFFSKGEVLHKKELYYCTAFGLIAVGILPPPPVFICSKKNKTSSNLKPSIDVIDTYINGELRKSVLVESFDLTTMSDDDATGSHSDDDEIGSHSTHSDEELLKKFFSGRRSDKEEGNGFEKRGMK